MTSAISPPAKAFLRPAYNSNAEKPLRIRIRSALAAISIYLAFAICALKLAWSDDPEAQAERLLGEESAQAS
jgi:hypothetical protein